MPLSYLSAPQTYSDLDLEDGMPPLIDSDDEVELGAYFPTAGTIINCDETPGPDEMLIYAVKHNRVRAKVVKRDDDLLTPEEVNKHWPEVVVAMEKELKTWAKLKCISRKARREARNIIDTRWVLKWKWDQPTVSAANSGSHGAEAVRIIRARLTIRGFKDQGKNDVDRYAGTSSKVSQKLLCSEAVARKWDICTTDISKAFLQGVTYEELSKLTGELLREVNFYLPASNIPILRKVQGFENFNPLTEVLHCDKPGTGSVDAPRAFSVKLKQTLLGKGNMTCSKIDGELLYRHNTDDSTC